MALNLGGRIDDFGDGFDCTAQAEVDPEDPSKRDRTAANTVLGEQHNASTGGVTRLSEQFRVENRMREIRWEERRMKWEKEEEEDRRRYWEKQKQLLQMICVIYFGGNKVVDNSPLAGTELAGTGCLHSPVDELNMNSPVFLEQELVEEKCGMDNSPLAGTELAGTGRLHSPVDELNMNSPAFLEQELDEEKCCDTGEDAVDILLKVDEQLTDGKVAVMPKAKVGPCVLENMAIEPGNPVVPGRVHPREPEYVLHSLARGSEEEPQFEIENMAIEPGNPVVPGRVHPREPEYVLHSLARGSEEEPQFENGQKEKPIVQALVVGDHAKGSEKMDEFEIEVEDASSSSEQDLGLEGSRGDSITGGFVEELMLVFERKSLSMRRDKEKETARDEMEHRLSGRTTLEKVFLAEQPAEELQDKVVFQELVLRANALEQVKQKTSRRERMMKQKWQGKSVMQMLAQKENSKSEGSRQKRQTVVGEEKTESEGLGAREEEVKLEDFGLELNFLGITEEEDMLKDLGGEKELYLREKNQVKSEAVNIRETETLLELEYVDEASLGTVAEQGYHADKMIEGVCKSRMKMKRIQKWKKVNQVELELGDIPEKMEMETEISVPGVGTEQINIKALVLQKQPVVAEPGNSNNADSSRSTRHDRENDDNSMAERKVEEKGDNTQAMTVGLGSNRAKAETVELDNLCIRNKSVEKHAVQDLGEQVAKVDEVAKAEAVELENLCIRDENVEKEFYVLELEAEEEVNQDQSVVIELAIQQSKGYHSYDSCEGYSEQTQTIVLDADDRSLVRSENQRQDVKPGSVSSERQGIGVDGRDEQLKQEKLEWGSREQLIAETRYNAKTRSRGKDPLGKSWRKRRRKQQKEKFFVRTGESSGRVENPSVKIMAEESDLCLRASRKELVGVRARQKMVKFKQARGKGDPKVRETVTELSWSKVTDSGKTDSETRQLSRSLGGKPAERQQLWWGENNSWTRGGDVLAGYSSILLFFTVVHALGVVNLEEGNLEAIMQWTVSWIQMEQGNSDL